MACISENVHATRVGGWTLAHATSSDSVHAHVGGWTLTHARSHVHNNAKQILIGQKVESEAVSITG